MVIDRKTEHVSSEVALKKLAEENAKIKVLVLNFLKSNPDKEYTEEEVRKVIPFDGELGHRELFYRIGPILHDLSENNRETKVFVSRRSVYWGGNTYYYHEEPKNNSIYWYILIAIIIVILYFLR